MNQAGIATAEQRSIHILGQLAHEGLICMTAQEGRQPTFALLSDWTPEAKTLPRDEALTNLTRRYFSSHGPTTASFLVVTGYSGRSLSAGVRW